jgi:hypothetical protein
MKLSITLEATRDKNADVKKAEISPVENNPTLAIEAKWIVEEAWIKAHEPGIEQSEHKGRLSWVGGAIRVYALITGEDPKDVLGNLPKLDVPTASVYDEAGISFKPISTQRPKPHPGNRGRSR